MRARHGDTELITWGNAFIFRRGRDYNSVFPSPQHRCQRPNVHAALLPSLEESLAERLVFRPESSNLMYGMYKSLFE
jgi:hypothetical protein